MEKVDIQVPNSWNILQNKAPGEIYVFHKFFPTGEDIIVSINMTANGYEVRSSAVSRTTEPSNTVKGITATLAEAAKIAETQCKWWDDFLDNYWKNKSQ